MNYTHKNLTNLLELPGLSNLVKDYTKPSIKADNTFLNRIQFKCLNLKNILHVFCYGNLILVDPIEMFLESNIKTLTSKGIVSLIGDANSMFLNAKSFNSDLSNWDVKNVKYMNNMFKHATSFNSDLSKWNVKNVRDATKMFRDATSFNSDLSMWDVKNAHCRSEFNYNAVSFDTKLLPKFCTRNYYINEYKS